jgi:hypothetical protein
MIVRIVRVMSKIRDKKIGKVCNSSSNSTPDKKSPLVGIIVGVVGGAIIVLVLVLLILYIRRRDNRRAQMLNENSNPFSSSLLPNSPQNYHTSEVSSLTPQPFSRRRESANSPASGSGSSRPITPPVIGTRIDPTNIIIRNTVASVGSDLEHLQHADSVRMPHTEGNLSLVLPGL